MLNPGNFALYNSKRVILLAIENDNAEILDGSIKTTAPLSELEPYRKTPQGMAPISMSAAQEHTVNAICATLGYQFNGLCMHDVSTFIGLFKEESMKKGHAK
jgi:hypothetical protein